MNVNAPKPWANIEQARALILRAGLSQYKECLWLDGAVLILPERRTFLIAGGSHTGKTTLSFLLSTNAGWKIVSEDIVLIDTAAQIVLPVAAPLSFRPDTQERIAQAGFQTRTPIAGSLYFDPELFISKPIPARFDSVVLLRELTGEERRPLALKTTKWFELMRELLPISNALRSPQALAAMEAFLEAARCHTLEGGTIGERLKAIQRL